MGLSILSNRHKICIETALVEKFQDESIARTDTRFVLKLAPHCDKSSYFALEPTQDLY